MDILYKYAGPKEEDGYIRLKDMAGIPYDPEYPLFHEVQKYIEEGGHLDPWHEDWEAFQLVEDLLKIDMEREIAIEEPFEFDGNTWYPNGDDLRDLLISTLLGSSGKTEIMWKTADKPDGINNVYRELDHTLIVQLWNAYITNKQTIWYTYDNKKVQLKEKIGNEKEEDTEESK